MTDRIVGFAAILISLLTLIIFIYQTNIMHQQSRLSVKPRLLFSSTLRFEDDTLLVYSILLENKGIGPAIVDSSFVTYEGAKYQSDWEDFFGEVVPELEAYGEFISYSNISIGETLSSDEEKVLFTYVCPVSQYVEVLEYLEVSDESNDLPLDMTIYYHSIYEDDKWVITSNQIPQKID